MTDSFTRLKYTHDIIINASKQQVFELLCLVRESEWLPGFSSKTIYSSSGVSELDSIFVTGEYSSNERFWVVPIYEKSVNILLS